MRERGKGAIVFISSNTAYRAIPNRSAYCASKGGINAMAKAFAVDLSHYGIRCNVVLPGTIKTERWHKMGSDQSKNITGTELIVDGGMSCQLYPLVLNDLKREKMERME